MQLIFHFITSANTSDISISPHSKFILIQNIYYEIVTQTICDNIRFQFPSLQTGLLSYADAKYYVSLEY